MWMLREECLDDAIIKLTKLLSSKDMCTASNAALVLARYRFDLNLYKFVAKTKAITWFGL